MYACAVCGSEWPDRHGRGLHEARKHPEWVRPRELRLQREREWHRRTRWEAFVLSANKSAKRYGITGRLAFADPMELGPCDYCGRPGEEWDHVVPLSGGGANERTNLVSACHSCNARKQDRAAAEFRSDPGVYRLLCGWCWAPITRTRRQVTGATRKGVRAFACSPTCGAHLASPPPMVAHPSPHTAYMREWRKRRKVALAL